MYRYCLLPALLFERKGVRKFTAAHFNMLYSEPDKGLFALSVSSDRNEDTCVSESIKCLLQKNWVRWNYVSVVTCCSIIHLHKMLKIDCETTVFPMQYLLSLPNYSLNVCLLQIYTTKALYSNPVRQNIGSSIVHMKHCKSIHMHGPLLLALINVAQCVISIPNYRWF